MAKRKQAAKKSPLNLILLLLLLFVGLAFLHKYLKTSVSNQQIATKGTTTIYKGMFPCADCSGIDMELILYPATYTIKQTYIGKNAAPFVTKGKWSATRGTPNDPNATVYELDPQDPGLTQYFLKVDDNTLQALDNSKEDIESPFSMTLTKQN